jgi:uncharacterized damage-inducible protein DinB
VNELERRQKIEAFGNAYFQLCDILRELPREMWEFKPEEDQWSVHDILIHLADSEANGYVRYRKAIAESGSSVIAYDQMAWATSLSYRTQNANDALELFRWLRATSYSIFRTLPESIWQNTVNHPEHGTMTLEQMIDLYVVHVEKHIGQMRRVYESWQSGNPPKTGA